MLITDVGACRIRRSYYLGWNAAQYLLLSSESLSREVGLPTKILQRECIAPSCVSLVQITSLYHHAALPASHLRSAEVADRRYQGSDTTAIGLGRWRVELDVDMQWW